MLSVQNIEGKNKWTGLSGFFFFFLIKNKWTQNWERRIKSLNSGASPHIVQHQSEASFGLRCKDSQKGEQVGEILLHLHWVWTSHSLENNFFCSQSLFVLTIHLKPEAWSLKGRGKVFICGGGWWVTKQIHTKYMQIGEGKRFEDNSEKVKSEMKQIFSHPLRPKPYLPPFVA